MVINLSVYYNVWASPRYYTVDPWLGNNLFKCHEEVLSLQPMKQLQIRSGKYKHVLNKMT